MIRPLFYLLLILCKLSITTCSSLAASPEARGIAPLVHGYVKEKPLRLLVIEKKSQQLMLFEQDATLELLHSFPCATGENHGNKLESGDSRTPEGIYYITEVYEDSKITVFGSRAFHLDYPNIFDTHEGRDGNGIFIHGTNKKLVPFSSNGCITLDNRDLDLLAPYLVINRIPIIIVESLAAPLNTGTPAITPNSPMFNGILHELRFAAEEVPVDNIDSLYFIEAGKEAVALVNYSIYDGDSTRYSYHKKVYFTQNMSGSWRSLYSVDGQDAVPYLIAKKTVKTGVPAVAPVVASVSTAPAVAPAAAPATKTLPVITKLSEPQFKDDKQSMLDFIEHWRHAWSSKNLEDYMDCYSSSFKSGEYDKEKWRAKKQYLNRKYTFIKVTVDNIAIKPTSSGALVSFFQNYRSDQYQTSGTKYLQLKFVDNEWKIQNEYM